MCALLDDSSNTVSWEAGHFGGAVTLTHSHGQLSIP